MCVDLQDALGQGPSPFRLRTWRCTRRLVFARELWAVDVVYFNSCRVRLMRPSLTQKRLRLCDLAAVMVTTIRNRGQSRPQHQLYIKRLRTTALAKWSAPTGFLAIACPPE